jgi:MFS family permease
VTDRPDPATRPGIEPAVDPAVEPAVDPAVEAAASAPDAAAAEALPRRNLELLADRTFAPFFWGNLASNCGLWFHNIAAAVVVFNLTGSALLVGAVSVMLFAATLLLGPYAGAVTDRVDRRLLMLAGQLLACASATSLAVWTAIVGAEGLPGAWPVLAATGLIGLGYAFSIPAMQALVPALVDPVDLDGAIALSSVTFNIARALGPALAAVTLVTAGPAAAFGVNALSYVPLVVALLVIRPRPVDTSDRGDGSVREGFRYVRGNPAVIVLLLATAGLGFGTDPVNTLTPPLAAELGGGDGLVGILVSAFGAGAVLATTIAARAGRRWGQVTTGAAGLTILTAGIGCLAVAPSTVAAVLALLLAGFGFLLGITGLTTALQRTVPEGLRGRVMALWSMAFLGSRPIAALLDGAIADLVSVRAATLVAAALSAAAAVLVITRLRHRRRHDAAPSSAGSDTTTSGTIRRRRL